MADDQCILKEDGYLIVATTSRSITYHPTLNVILVFGRENEVKILDVNSGVILQSCTLSEGNGSIQGRYMPLQEKILFWDKKNIGFRGDYNGVLLLDTILQTPVLQNEDMVRLELLLTEAFLFHKSLQTLEEHGVECPSDVSNELIEKIKEAQSGTKKGIKAQKWSIICLELPYSSLKLVANNVVYNLKRLDRHIPALAIASAINERLTDLLAGSRVLDTCNSGNYQRVLMYSEATRRQTFEKWPHMDYKWALPDQMAQAGFYHQPSVTGEDKAMCFTCSVCLVSWEKTDEPWSEHERHSPSCPFVKGEYTQNVPLSVTYATNPAVATSGIDVISNSDNANVLCISNSSGEISVWSIERQLKKMHTFKICDYLRDHMPDVSERFLSTVEVTAICVLPYRSTDSNGQSPRSQSINLKDGMLGSKIIVGFSAKSVRKAMFYLIAFDIIDNEKTNESAMSEGELIQDSSGEGITQKIDMDQQLTFTINDEFAADESLKNEILKLSDLSMWKFTESEKSDSFTNFPCLEDDIVKIDKLTCQVIHDAEELLHQTTLSSISQSESKTILNNNNNNLNENIQQQQQQQQQKQQQQLQEEEKIEKIRCIPYCIIQVLSASCDMKIQEIIPVNNCNNLLVLLMSKDEKFESYNLSNEDDVYSQIVIYNVDKNSYIKETPVCTRNFNCKDSPREICVLPPTENLNRKISLNPTDIILSMVTMSGNLELAALKNLKTITTVTAKNEKFISLTFCKSLDRICVCTENGSLIFYSLYDTDFDSADELGDEENISTLISYTPQNTCPGDGEFSEIDGSSGNLRTDDAVNSSVLGNTNLLSITGEHGTSAAATTFLAYKNNLSVTDLQTLHSLTIFDEMLTPYTAEVPSCWNELVQAHKQRRNPQRLRPGDDAHLIRAWRLHNDATTWDEHIIELTLSKPASLGHIDFKFSLYQQCPSPPAIQVTLLKQNTSGFGYRMKAPPIIINVGKETEVDENIEFSLNGNEEMIHENPVLTEEYLSAHNAEIICGPIELDSCIDLCEQGGLVTLTSPKLFKTKGRNFLLHIKTMVDPSKGGQGKTRGCDWLHEISITIRNTKNDCKLLNERQQRIAMLESNNFLENLVLIACSDQSSLMEKNISLDILIWICTIRLTRYRSPKLTGEKSKDKFYDHYHVNSRKPEATTSASSSSTSFSSNTIHQDCAASADMANQQAECVLIIEKHIKEFMLNCIINGDRTMAHKFVKLILIISDGVHNMPSDQQAHINFDISLKEAILHCLPKLVNTKYASAVRWFTLMLKTSSSAESHTAISEVCMNLLMQIAQEIDGRWNPYCSLLQSRFGLYGFPFEPDLFDVELPQITKGNSSSPNTLVNIIKSNAGLLQPNGMDFKRLNSIDGVEFRLFPHLIKCKAVSNQLRGLLEVEPLHFTCFAASEATRIENIDSLNSNTASNVNMEEIIVTPLQNNIENHVDPMKKDLDKDDVYYIELIQNLKDKICTKIKKQKSKEESGELKPNGFAIEHFEVYSADKSTKLNHPKFKAICEYIESCDENSTEYSNLDEKLSSKIQKYLNENSTESENIFSWHKLLTAPPKQMVVVERIHSGARRFVVIDFGSPILLTDLVIPACDELASLFIDIWCFNEETDCVRLVVCPDIGTRSLVLSDLQPPPICRYMKITIIGRYGMSATKCKIPIGNFYGHVIPLESDAYADPLLPYIKSQSANISAQVKALNVLYEDVHCRYSLASTKLIELLNPILRSEMSNVAHMQAFINKQKDDDFSAINNNKTITTYEECIALQHQMNVIKTVIDRLDGDGEQRKIPVSTDILQSCSRDKLRVLSECFVEILLHYTMEYGLKNIFSLHSFFNMDVANVLFNTLVVSGDAHIQLATCSLLVRMCCFQSWWGDFLTNIFCSLFSSQNSKVFPQDRIFFLLTYLGRKSIAMGTCRSIVIDSILKTTAKLVAPISLRYIPGEDTTEGGQRNENSLSSKTDLQLITWLLLFLSVCLDDNTEKKEKSANRWEFMSCEADFTKTRSQTSSNCVRNYRSFKRRIVTQPKYNGLQPYTDWGKKIHMLQNELPEVFMELTGKSKPKISKANSAPKVTKTQNLETENFFDRGLKSIKLGNILVVIRGLITLTLEMDFTCNMDLFLLTCKVIARLASACRPSIQLSRIITTNQLEQLVRLAVWNDQRQPWAVHAITCLLQDLLDADKNYKETVDKDMASSNNEINLVENVLEAEEIIVENQNSDIQHQQHRTQHVVKDISYADTVKYGQLPSLVECEDPEYEEFVNELDMLDQLKNSFKRPSPNKNSFNFFCKTVSCALDARLDSGLDTNVEINIRRLTMLSSLNMYASLPQIPTTELINTSPELAPWPEYIANIWSGPEYNSGISTYQMFKNIFDNIFSDLHSEDTWAHLEQVLQMWLTLNSELSEKPYNSGLSPNDIPRIPLGPTAVQGLLLALAWHNGIKIRAWCLGFQSLILACNSYSNSGDSSSSNYAIGEVIVKDENFEKMLLRFFSGYGMNLSTTVNRCVGPTICRYLHELLIWLQMKAEYSNPNTNIKKKLKDTLLNIILQLVQPGGAIFNQQGPIDAQSQLIRDLVSIHYDKADLNVAVNIIESISFLAFNNISNTEKIQCQRSCDNNGTNNAFGSLFATVLGADNSKQNSHVSDNSLIISLLKLATSLIQTELYDKKEEIVLIDLDSTSESQTDEIKAEQKIVDNKVKIPCIADAVLQHFPTMKRLLGCLSNCCSYCFTLSFALPSIYPVKTTESTWFVNEPQTTADVVFHLLMLLSEKASNPKLVVAPIYQYLEANTTNKNILPRLQLSEPFLWYVLKVLETPTTVLLFSQMGGIKVLCQNVVRFNKALINMQPGMISLIMQHMTKNTKIKFTTTSGNSGNNSKKSQQKMYEGLINFAPFSSISSENTTAQPAEILIQTPITSHRRARTAAWTYMFYPNESHVDLTITLPTAIMLKEIQLLPHLPTLASCPSAVAIEIARDGGLGPIPLGQPLPTVGMTCIRLQLVKPEIATSIVLRLYRPKDSSSIGLTQITVLGTTIFNNNIRFNGGNYNDNPLIEEDSLAKTSFGWIRLLARCFSVATFNSYNDLSNIVISTAAEYPGFLEAVCNLLNVMPSIPSISMQNLETVLLKLGNHSKDLGLTLIHNLLWSTTPQIYRLTNEVVCDLLYDLCANHDEHTFDKVSLLINWILKLQENFSNQTMRCSNPQSGFVNCIASILWTLYTDNIVLNLQKLITTDVFDTCLYWIDILENSEPLKVSFDALLCSLCCIKPELFNQLLKRFGVVLIQQQQQQQPDPTEAGEERENTYDNKMSCGITDDNKEISGTEWYHNVANQNLSTILQKPGYLDTLAMASQSPLAVYQLVDSGLPKLLAYALFEYCRSLSPEVKRMTSTSNQTPETCLTDSDKAENCGEPTAEEKNDHENFLIKVHHVPKILNFFSECCSEGHMRDWLGSNQGSIFWKPLLELLCNYRPPESNVQPMQQAFIDIEIATINFFSRITSCHPKNQENFTQVFISVIKKPDPVSTGEKPLMSGFTRRVVLQLLLENERILISVRSKVPLQRKEQNIHLVDKHPSRRINSHHLLFYLSVNTKCQEILQNCISAFSNIIPTSGNGDSQQYEIPLKSNISGTTNQQSSSKRELFDSNAFKFSGHMEFLSVAAGVTAKDKRLKDAKNQVAALKDKDAFSPEFSRLLTLNDEFNIPSYTPTVNGWQFIHLDCPDIIITNDATISQILSALYKRGVSLSTRCLTLVLQPSKTEVDELNDDNHMKAANMEPLPSPLQKFSSKGGLSLLAHYLPVVYPENSKSFPVPTEKEKSPVVNDWVKLEPEPDEICEYLEGGVSESIAKTPTITSVPQHSLAAFGLFLRLPAYSDVLLRDKLKAQCILRLVLGVTGDGEGNDIYNLPLAPSLPTLPFEVFRQLLDSSPLTTDDGVLLRRMVIEVGAMNLVLNCLAIFTHQSQNTVLTNTKTELGNGAKSSSAVNEEPKTSDDKSHVYWAKGTGFGTGSIQQSWDVEQALLRQKSEEEHVTVLLQVLSSYINPGDKNPLQSNESMNSLKNAEVTSELPAVFLDMLKQSCLISALSSYLRNDSVLDITRHIPLYRSILQLLRAISLSSELVCLLQPRSRSEVSMSIAALLTNMKNCVDTYAKRLKVNKKSNIKGQTQKVTVNLDDGDDEGLALLIPDIQETTMLVQKATKIEVSAGNSRDQGGECTVECPLIKSIEERYLEIMKKLQFDTFEMIVESEDGYRFVVSHHFENNVRMAGERGHPSRVKRLAQETVTLSTSLPLSYSSSVFVRCDTDRLDIMKVLITGPADTPYANGCFEFDVYFPPDYPNSPMLINLETTGRHSVRFNPNLYNDGKVCLSVLNTWHGRPEEKWNAQTSSFLQVLVSIQSLILVPEPYFNEPGYERSRGTPSGSHCSREYNSNIYQACVRWAMLEQIRHPSPCFKEVIQTHFWLKRHEICAQIEEWIDELNKPQCSERSGRTISFNSMVLRRQYRQLREELAKLPVPEGLEDLNEPFNPNVTTLSALTDINTSGAGVTTITVPGDLGGTTKDESSPSSLSKNPSVSVVSTTDSATTTTSIGITTKPQKPSISSSSQLSSPSLLEDQGNDPPTAPLTTFVTMNEANNPFEHLSDEQLISIMSNWDTDII